MQGYYERALTILPSMCDATAKLGVPNAFALFMDVATEHAERDGVEIKCYRVIYDCINEIEAAIKGMLAPKFRDVDIGKAEVRQVVKISSIVTEDVMASLRRFKDDVKEVAQGFDCGIGLEKYNDIKEGDIFEFYITEEYKD